MKRAIIMARVSSDEQAKGYSLDIQVDKLSTHCAREGIQVVNVYREDHSAKNFNRPEFKKLLTYLKANKGKVDLLLVTSWDRFSRNVTESFATIEKLRLLGVEVQAVEQPLDLSVPENLMILSVYLTLPDIDNKRRSIKITEGVRAARAAGRWIGKPPFGYKKARDEKDKPILVPNEKAALVRKAFQLIAGGKSQADLTAYLKKRGVSFPKSTLSDLLRNQVYIGNIWVQSEGGGYSVKGVHPPLVEEALFLRVQERLEAHLQKKNFTKAKAFKPELHLRGLLLCDNCGEHLTGSASKARNGERHHYYHCNHCGQVRVRAAATHQHMEAILGEFQVKAGAVKLYEKMVKSLLAKEVQKKRPLSKIQEEMRQNEQRLKNIQDDFADRLIDVDT
ncbi:MAG: recombinase family protein, partial [Sphingobacteriales bacterium]